MAEAAAGQEQNKDQTMTKADLVEEVTRVTELPRKESEAVVETIFESIISALQADDKIEIRGFGSFRTRERRGRTGRNPKTGAKVEVPPKKIPYFKPSKELKDFINETGHDSGHGSQPANPGGSQEPGTQG
jgi:integration host factor subunit beta